MGISMIFSSVSMLLMGGSNFSAEAFIEKFSSGAADLALTFKRYVYITSGVELAAIIAGIYYRIKTIRH